MIDIEDIQTTAHICASRMQSSHVKNYWSLKETPRTKRNQDMLAFAKFLADDTLGTFSLRKTALLSEVELCLARLERWQLEKKNVGPKPSESSQFESLCRDKETKSILIRSVERVNEMMEVQQLLLGSSPPKQSFTK